MKSSLPHRVLLALLVIGASSFHGIYLWREMGADLTGRPVAEAPFTVGRLDGVIRALTPAGDAAGLVVGERLIAVDGEAFSGAGTLARAVWDRAPGSELHLTIGSATGEAVSRDATVVLQEDRVLGKRPWSGLLVLSVMLLAPFFCIAVGGFVVGMRPRDPLAWVLLGLMFSFARLACDREWLIWSLPRGWCELAMFYYSASMALWPVWMLLFGLHFSGPLPVGRLARAAINAFVLLLAGVALMQIALAVGVPNHVQSIESLARLGDRLGRIPAVMQMLAIGMFFTAIGWKSGIAKTPDAARRLNLMKWGAMISLTPSFLIVVTSMIRGQASLEDIPEVVAVIAILLLFVFPLTLAYVIVVHRAMDVRVVLRLGLQYALAKGAVRTLQISLSLLAVVMAAQGVIAGDASRPGRLRAAALGIWAVVLLGVGAKRMLRWTDRRFFREAYDAELLLTELTEQMRTTIELGPLLNTLTTRVGEALHVPKIALLLPAEGAYRVAAQRGLALDLQSHLTPDGAVVGSMLRDPRPVKVYLDESPGGIDLAAGAEQDRDLLRQMESQLLLPLTVKDKLLGILSLGSKRSEEPYTPRDLRLLTALASQAAMSLENTRLVAAVASETEQRVRMSREIEIAREVQERLFPQTLPVVKGLELAGRCRPAMGIGGDYYDFLALPDGRVGIAIGDVSGKGIPAALLMAGLRAALRGQAIGGITDLARLMDHVNTLVYESSSANRYATFFYAEFDPASRVLTYCNAGHNHPMVIRGRGETRRVMRLEQGGMVVGLMEGAPYEQAAIALQPGDLVVAFTDGISEARNLDDEEWGETALLAAIAQAPSTAPADLITTLFTAADAFVNGAKQHDDMTLISLRVT